MPDVTVSPVVQSVTVSPGGTYYVASTLEIDLGGPSSGRNYTLGNLVNAIEEGAGSTANVVLGGGTTGQPNQIDGLSIVRSIVGGYDNYIGRPGAVDGSGDTGLAASIVGGKHCLIRRPTSTADHTAYNPVAVTATQVGGTFPNHGMICGAGYAEIRNGTDGFIGGGYGHALYQTDGTNGKADKAFIGGGYGNGVSGDYGAIVAGNANRVSQPHGFIGNGFQCHVTNTPGETEGNSGIVIGYQNRIDDSSYAFIGGGGNNLMGMSGNSGLASFGVIGGGYQNAICNDSYAHSLGGYGWASTISGGWKNAISVGYASIPGGFMNRVEAEYGSASGSDAVAHTPYYHVIGHQQATMGDSASGKHQTGTVVMRVTTTDGNWNYATANGYNITIRDNHAASVRILVIAKRDQSTQCHGWSVEGVVNNLDGTISLIGGWSVTAIGATPTTAWDFDPAIISNNLTMRCRGQASATVHWTVRVDMVEVYAEPPTPV